MTSPVDSRDEFSTDEDVHSPKIKKCTAQVSRLPFSVEALMSDKRPHQQPAGTISATENGSYSLSNSRETNCPEEFSQHFVPAAPAKSDSSEREDCASWMSRVKLSSPTGKC